MKWMLWIAGCFGMLLTFIQAGQILKVESDPSGGFAGFFAEGRAVELALLAAVCMAGGTCIDALQKIREELARAAKNAQTAAAPAVQERREPTVSPASAEEDQPPPGTIVVAMPPTTDVLVNYTSFDGTHTERRITVQQLRGQVKPRGGVEFSTMIAFCHLRQGVRTFRLDGVTQAVDPATGEILPNLLGHLLAAEQKRKRL